MIGILVTGHGNFGSGLTSSLELIVGKQNHYYAIDFIEGMTTEQLATEYEKAICEMKSCDGILVLSDLGGGSPFKTAVICSQGKTNIEVIAGTNLPLLLEAAMGKDFASDVTLFAQQLITTGKEQVLRFELANLKSQQSTSEDGI